MSSAGWWPDPLGRHEMRYHDGDRWTEHVSDQGHVSVNPIAAPTPPASAPMPAPQPASPFAPPPRSPAPQAVTPDPFAPPTTAPVNSPFGSDAPPPALPFGSGFEPPPPLIQEAGTSRKVLWFVIGLIVLGVIVATAVVLAARADDDDVATSVPPTAAPTPSVAVPGTTALAPPETSPPATQVPGTQVPGTQAPATAVPGTTAVVDPAVSTVPVTGPPPDGIPDGGAGPVPLGTTVRAEGSLVRVNSVNLDAPGDDFFEPEEGNTITAIEVEACAGPGGFASNSFYWSVFLPGDTAADSFLFADELAAVEVAPGGCIRGTVTYEMPAGATVASVVLTNSVFSEIARWRTEGAVAVTERLAPEIPPTAVALGSPVVWGPNHRATVQSVEDAAPPLDDFFPPEPGRQYNRITVEMCAGDEPLPVNGLAWFGVGPDHWMASTVLLGDTLPTIELAAGECVAGSLQIGMPEGTGTAYVVYAEPGAGEVGRWSIG